MRGPGPARPSGEALCSDSTPGGVYTPSQERPVRPVTTAGTVHIKLSGGRPPEPVEELWGRYRRRMPHLVRCRPEVLDGLSRLRTAGWRVAIVTNGTADNQLGKIRNTGLADAVDAWVLSGAEGIRKPDTRLFEIAAQRCGTTLAKGGWMVGDNLVADVGGGQGAGLRTIWIDRGTWPGRDHAAHHVVTDVIQAMEILRRDSAPA